MVQKIDRQELQMLFLEALNGADYRFIEGLNPFHILLNGAEYWIYIKNLTSAHFENPDVWRAQLPQRDDFQPIKESEADFILLGYDGDNDVYATWNPIWVKQRLNSTGNVSFYSRLSLQEQARGEKQFKRMELSNEGEVVVFPRELVKMFFINVQNFFLAEGDYVAIGSKRRPEANEAFKTFTDTANIAEFAKYLADKGMSQVTIGNYCRVVKNLISDGTITKNRKLFYTYDSISEYHLAIPQFIILDDVREKNEKWHNLVSAALNAYIDYLQFSQVSKNKPETEHNAKNDDKSEESVRVLEDCTGGNLFDYFCSDEALQQFEEYLSHKGYLQSTVKRYIRAIEYLFDNRVIQSYRKLFDAHKSYNEYAGAVEELFKIPEIRTLNEHKHHEYSASLKQYIAYLCETYTYLNKESNSSLQDDNPAASNPDKTIDTKRDWEAEFTDTSGKLTRIANPELLDILRPYLNVEYTKKAAAFNAIDKFYGNRFPSMSLADWGKLLNAIDWSDPYVRKDTTVKNPMEKTTFVSIDPPKRSKTHILRVEFPDGTVFQDRNVSETYAKAIKKIDPDLVSLLEISHAGVDIVSKELDTKYAQYQKPIGDGWYVMTNSSTNAKYSDLQIISDELEQDLIISLVPLDGSKEYVVPRIDVPDGSRAKIRVTFPDGHVIQPAKVLEALLEVVKFAGAERVRDLNIICCGDNLILKNPAPRYKKPCKDVGEGWLCNTRSGTDVKFAQINEINDKLELGLSVEIISI